MRRLIKTPAVIARARSARSNLTLLLILLSIAVATPISAEEIRLTTIVPDQTIERAKKGVIGDNYSNPDPGTGGITNNSIPTSGLLVEGNVGIGTTAPGTTLDVSGPISVRGTGAPAVSPAGQGRIYYDSGLNKFQASENGGAYGPLGAGSSKIFSAIGTTDISLDAGVAGTDVYADMPDMSITQNFANEKALITFNAYIIPFGVDVYVRLLIDGVGKHVAILITSNGAPLSLTWVESLSAGSHTIKVQ